MGGGKQRLSTEGGGAAIEWRRRTVGEKNSERRQLLGRMAASGAEEWSRGRGNVDFLCKEGNKSAP
jgi:hypothetical protein